MESTVKLSDKCDLLLKPTSKHTVHFVNFPNNNILGSALLYSTQTCICTVSKLIGKDEKISTLKPTNLLTKQSPNLHFFHLLNY